MAGRILDAALFAGAALIFLGLSVAMTYEALALLTGAVPTISDIVAGSVLSHPIWSRLGFMAAGLVIGGLAVHFGGWRP